MGSGAHQEEFHFSRPEVAGVDADEDVVRLVLHVPVLVHPLAHPGDLRSHVPERLEGRGGEERAG